MIVKHYVPRTVSDVRLKAGVAAEKQMAHYLDRHFRDARAGYGSAVTPERSPSCRLNFVAARRSHVVTVCSVRP